MKNETAALIKRARRARIIAQMINKEDTDTRGILFNEIGKHLDSTHTQHFTAKLFYKIAKEYGMPPNDGAKT